MLAKDLAERVPTVTPEMTGAQAARIVAEYRLSGLVVADARGIPEAVIPGSQILGLILPSYVAEEPGLAHAFDEASADELARRLNHVTIGELVERRRLTVVEVPSVLPEDTLVEIVAVMVSGHHPLILVRAVDGEYVGTIMTSRVLAAIATLAGHDSALIRRRLERDIADRGKPWVPVDPHADPQGDDR